MCRWPRNSQQKASGRCTVECNLFTIPLKYINIGHVVSHPVSRTVICVARGTGTGIAAVAVPASHAAAPGGARCRVVATGNVRGGCRVTRRRRVIRPGAAAVPAVAFAAKRRRVALRAASRVDQAPALRAESERRVGRVRTPFRAVHGRGSVQHQLPLVPVRRVGGKGKPAVPADG